MPNLYLNQTESDVASLLGALKDLVFQAHDQTHNLLRHLDSQSLTHLTYSSPEFSRSSIGRWFIDNQPTGSLVIHELAPKENVRLDAPRIPSDQVRLITSFIGLGKSQVATIFGVSRQTLYDWLKGKIEPTGVNATRVSILSRAMSSACKDLHRPLYHGYITKAPSEDEQSILELLGREEWVEKKLTQAFAQARRLTDERGQQLGLSRSIMSRTQGDNNQLDNSIALGLE